jgi:hypothetical protein
MGKIGTEKRGIFMFQITSNEVDKLQTVYNNVNMVMDQIATHPTLRITNCQLDMIDASLNQLKQWMIRNFGLYSYRPTDEEIASER